ncbi:hypothetical protein Hanom_Chr09g00807021 [Helianthus anomalus]
MKHLLEEFEEMVVVHHMLYKTVTQSNVCSSKIGVTFDQRNFKVTGFGASLIG